MSPSSPPTSPFDVGVLVPAAGQGIRAGGGEPKQFRPIAGVPMLLRAIRPFASHPRVRAIVVALPAGAATQPPAWLAELHGDRLCLVPGGATRAESVRGALAALDAACRIVLVHDAARPFVTRETIDAVIAVAERGVGAVAAVPVGDTLKRADEERRVTGTVPRDGLWRAQTPQGFPRRMLERVYETGDPAATDDAALVEAAGHPVELVPDVTSNFKVTTSEDFAVAEAIARR